MKGLELCRKYYEEFGAPMLAERFPGYLSKIAVGLVGEGSDRMGFDDEVSRDHDWGPGFCIWVTKETYEEIGEQLQEAYEELPKEYMGFCQNATPMGEDRYGVSTIEDFYTRLIGSDRYEELDWRTLDDVSLLSACDGEVFTDEEGIFSKLRDKLKEGYPEDIRYFKIAEDIAHISQTGQYNFFRMLERGDRITADRMLSDCMGHLMRLAHHIYNQYPPHDKWLYQSLGLLPNGEIYQGNIRNFHSVFRMSDEEAKSRMTEIAEKMGSVVAHVLYEENFISDIDPYLDSHSMELVMKGAASAYSTEELVEKIVRLEFEAFDQVQNEGGRASCQDDYVTFYQMRASQYLTYTRTMLLQYYYDFRREYDRGHNLITEKYGRMMESTAPEEYAKIADHFPKLSEEKKAIIDQIVELQVQMSEEFAKKYPKAFANARSLRSVEDHIYNTSLETYLRGEISTYSDKMLELYGRYVVKYIQAGSNIMEDTVTHTARFYGYKNLEELEASMK